MLCFYVQVMMIIYKHCMGDVVALCFSISREEKKDHAILRPRQPPEDKMGTDNKCNDTKGFLLFLAIC